MKTIDLSTLPTGRRYEDQYGRWLDVFKEVAEGVALGESYSIIRAPASWVSLLYYLGAKVESYQYYFEQDNFIHDPIACAEVVETVGNLRELVEMHSASRPELVDSLYKADVQWKVDKSKWRHRTKKEFKVTCNGSFFRPEVLDYINNVLPTYKPVKHKCVIVPCAADKPYPAELHKAVRANISDDYEIIIGTGVLGIVPEGLWPQMPLYDSGLPYQWRLMKLTEAFFCMHADWYVKVVVYSDFYNTAIYDGLMNAAVALEDGLHFKFVNKVQEYSDYLPLLSPELLDKLKKECR